MKRSENTEESFKSSIEAERASGARSLCPSNVNLSKLIREHHDRKRSLYQQTIKTTHKENHIEVNDYIHPAHYDSFTGLINPRFMTLLLEKSLQLAKEREKILAIFYLELNGLNMVKNIYGDAIAEEVLLVVTRRLKLAVRKKDHVSYLQGNKYLVGLMLDNKGIRIAESIKERIMKSISKSIYIKGFRVCVSMKVCSVAYPIHGDKINVLLDIANKKMYKLNKALS